MYSIRVIKQILQGQDKSMPITSKKVLIYVLFCSLFSFLFAADKLIVIRNAPLLAGPESYYRPIDSLQSQTILTIVEKSGEWYLVRLANGKAGWVNANNVKVLETPGNGAPPTNGYSSQPLPEKHVNQSNIVNELKIERAGFLRQEPDKNSKVIGQLSVGLIVKKLDAQADWLKIQVPNGNTGWANRILFEPKIKPVASRKAILIKNGNLRAEARLDAPVIQVIPAGTTIALLDSLGDWYRVELNGSSGWLNKMVIQKVRS